jgi:hypothetical protein
MARSRSSFDLSGAIATAASLSTTSPEEVPNAIYRGKALVSFGPTATGPASVPPAPPPPDAPPASSEGGEGAFPVSSRQLPNDVPPAPDDAPAAEGARRAPHLPDLSSVVSPTERCERIAQWIVTAVGAQDVFIADAAGLPIAGVGLDLADVEPRLAAAGVVAASIAHLANAIPGNQSPLFELHVGEGPFFQLIGFESGPGLYLIGLTRATPLTYRQAHAVRLACRHALGEPGVRAADPSGGNA